MKYQYLLLILLIYSCTKSQEISSNDQSTVETVKVGTQYWMKQNLSVDRFRNGDIIPEAKSDSLWNAMSLNGIPAWCYHEENPNDIHKLGKLYNFWAVIDSRGLSPKGFHVPTNKEWSDLIDHVGGVGKANYVLKSKNGWMLNGNGSDGFSWTGLPSGSRIDNGVFNMPMNFSADWWTSTESDINKRYANFWGLVYAAGDIGRGVRNKGSGLSVRCIRD
jgi:uncharacterized protein (TIGR02145 family)